MKQEKDPIIEKLESEAGMATYTFYRFIIGQSQEGAEKEAEELAYRVKSFGASFGIKNISAITIHDNMGMTSVLSTFQIKHSQDGILIKVAALFAFAALSNSSFPTKHFLPNNSFKGGRFTI